MFYERPLMKRTKATDISKAVREAVYERDKWCVYCGKQGIPNAHYIPRSAGGLGIEQNILTLCPECHNRYDNGHNRAEMQAFFREYLMSKYPDWDEENLIYRRYK